MDSKWAIKHIADLINRSRNTVIFSGAGISTESGLPDFRSNDGLWAGQDPMVIAHTRTLKSNPSLLVNFYRDRIVDASNCKYNDAHRILAEWETQGKVWGIATQNVDGYHQQAGSQNVMELHGNMGLYCTHCMTPYEHSKYIDGTGDSIGQCDCREDDGNGDYERCSGVVRPNITLFGEDLNVGTFSKARKTFGNAKLCIILGSSCSVYPANSLPQLTINNGGEVVIINKTSTDLDHLASYSISEISITEALIKIDRLIER